MKIYLNSTINKAFNTMNKHGSGCLVVIDFKTKKVVGTLSDGDIRKKLLFGTKLSDKIEDGGCVIEANGNKGLLDIDRNEIIKIFENKGIILFKNFNIDEDQIVKFTDLFTLQYANDANRREIRFENPKLHNVDPGKMEMPLHSEASYSPSWPEIVWFYCRLAPKKSGQTTVCDGRSIYKN